MNLEHTTRVKTSHLEDTKLIYWITVTSTKTSFPNHPNRITNLRLSRQVYIWGSKGIDDIN